MAFIIVAASGAITHGQDVLQDYGPNQDLEDANFCLEERPNYRGAQWIFDENPNNLIGYAPWNSVKRRWTLFKLKGEHFGYIQAIVGQFLHPPHYINTSGTTKTTGTMASSSGD